MIGSVQLKTVSFTENLQSALMHFVERGKGGHQPMLTQSLQKTLSEAGPAGPSPAPGPPLLNLCINKQGSMLRWDAE